MQYNYEKFCERVGVSRETFLQLQCYVELLEKWQSKINLVSNTTLAEVWERHILDSAQLMSCIDSTKALLDIGSGAGFPGMVLAILGNENITLVESDSRKGAFLREVARVTHTKIQIECKRIEVCDIAPYGIITCRAFAEIQKILSVLEKNVSHNPLLLLLKGKNYQAEIEAAKQKYTFKCKHTPSITNEEAVILHITDIQKIG